MSDSQFSATRNAHEERTNANHFFMAHEGGEAKKFRSATPLLYPVVTPMANLNNDWDSGTFVCSVAGVNTTVQFKTKGSQETYIDFSFMQKPYTFYVTKWSRNGLRTFLSLFIAYYGAGDRNQFATLREDEDGNNFYDYNDEQKKACLRQGINDIMITLGKIFAKHGRGILDYAVWYRETHLSENNYDLYITRICCHCVVHCNFIAPNAVFEIVRFSS